MWTEDRGSEGENQGAASYRAFLLRCWLEENGPPDGRPGWRFTLQQAGSEPARRGFASLQEVMSYLEETLELAPVKQGGT